MAVAVAVVGVGAPGDLDKRKLAISGVALLLPFALAAVGALNPWNLTYVDIRFTAPYLGALFLTAVVLVVHVHTRDRSVRVVSLAVLSVGLLLGYAVVRVWTHLVQPIATRHADNVHNDVELEMTSTYNAWSVVVLRADRGLLSRRHRIATIGHGGSAPPDVEVAFVTADQLMITADGQELYWARFDPDDLRVEDHSCRPYQGGPVPGCV